MRALHRRIEVATAPGEARAVVEDDYHHFRVLIRHRRGQVVEAASQALRSPTVLCPVAGERLSELHGMALDPSSAAALGHTDARQQCTHMIDIAGLAIAAAARGIDRRSYAAVVPDRQEGVTHPVLYRDGSPVLSWRMTGATITNPAPFKDLNIGSGFTGWVRRELGLEEAEAALVLRRAVSISGGRGVDLDAPGRKGPMGRCWTWQPERAPEAIAGRNVGSTLDFSGRADELTRADQAWLRFEA